MAGTGKVDKNQPDRIVARETYPLASKEADKGAVWLTVGSVEQLSLRINIPHKQKSIVIRGTHSYALAMPYIPKYATTQVLKEDWDWICQDEALQKHPSFSVFPGKLARIFVEKNESETIARALDSETQELSKQTGSNQLTEKDLQKSGLVTGFNDAGGVTDATVASKLG